MQHMRGISGTETTQAPDQPSQCVSYCEETSHADAHLCFSSTVSGISEWEKKTVCRESSRLRDRLMAKFRPPDVHQRTRSFCSQYFHNTGDHQASPGDYRKNLSKRDPRCIPCLRTCHSACHVNTALVTTRVDGTASGAGQCVPGSQNFPALRERCDARADKTHLGLCHMITILFPRRFRTT